MNDDLISRLSEIRSEYNCFDENEEPYYRALSEAIKILSRRADGDTISRQAAIELIKNYCENGCDIAEDNWCPSCQRKKFVELLKALPSAQHEPIRLRLDHELSKEEYERLKKDCAEQPIILLPKESAQQWIPCSERLPEEEDIYIVAFDKRCLRKDEIQVSDAIWKDNQWQYQMLESFEKRMPRLVVEPIKELKVIAWMPLPEPYKGEES